MTELPAEEYAAKLELYEMLIATNPNVVRKGASVPCNSLNGHMFSFLTQEGQEKIMGAQA